MESRATGLRMRRVMEKLSSDGDGGCDARSVFATHARFPHDKPPLKDGKPGGWHKADAPIWNDLGAACIPHAAL